MQTAPDEVVRQHPAGHADEPEEKKCGPGARDLEAGVAEREAGEAEGAVGGAKEGFGAGFDQGGEGDGEFAHP